MLLGTLRQGPHRVCGLLDPRVEQPLGWQVPEVREVGQEVFSDVASDATGASEGPELGWGHGPRTCHPIAHGPTLGIARAVLVKFSTGPSRREGVDDARLTS